MAKYRHDLPQRRGGIFLTDGGMETTLIFHEGIELPHFAAFVLLDSAEGRQKLKRYYEAYLAVAREHGAGFVLDSPTWRANPDWGDKLGYDAAALTAINVRSIAFLEDLRAELGKAERALRHQRRHRPARRRLQGRQHGCGGGRGLSCRADCGLRRRRRRHGDGVYAEQRSMKRSASRARPGRSEFRW